jgi:hypothetical protein
MTSVTLSAAAPGAIAQANCDLYGKLALGQQQQNEELKCGFTGSAWSPDLKTRSVEGRASEPPAAARRLQIQITKTS